jgi:hypothetical protein
MQMNDAAQTRRPRIKLNWTKVRPGCWKAATSREEWFAERIDGEWTITIGGELSSLDGVRADTRPTVATAKTRAAELATVACIPPHRR